MYRKVITLVFSVLLAGAILGVMLYRVWGDLAEALQYIIPLYLVPACGICLVSWFIRGGRYKVILGRISVRVPLLFSTACIFLSQTVNLVVPARLGDLIRVVLLRHDYEATVSQGLSSLIVERIFDILSVTALGIVAVIFIVNVPSWVITLLVIPLLLGGIFLLVLLFTGRLASGNRYIQYILTMLGEIRRASLTPSTALLLAVTSLVIWLFDTFICVAVSAMFRQDIPFTVVLLAIVAGNLVKAVPLTPGGVGTYEFALALVFEIAGVTPAVSTLIAVIDHLIKNGITLAGGAASIFWLGDWVIPELSASIRKRLNEES